MGFCVPSPPSNTAIARMTLCRKLYLSGQPTEHYIWVPLWKMALSSPTVSYWQAEQVVQMPQWPKAVRVLNLESNIHKCAIILPPLCQRYILFISNETWCFIIFDYIQLTSLLSLLVFTRRRKTFTGPLTNYFSFNLILTNWVSWVLLTELTCKINNTWLDFLGYWETIWNLSKKSVSYSFSGKGY